MVLSTKRFGTVIVAVGIILLLVGLLAVPGWAQDGTDPDPGEDQYAPDVVVPGPDEDCPGADVILTETGTGDQQSAPFTVTGERFRVTLTSVPTGGAGEDDVVVFVDITNNDNNEFVTGISQDSAGTESSFVNVGPGEFFLDILAGNAAYTITVEDCVGEDQAPPPADDNPPGDDDVINVPDKPLPNTGGFPPLLALGFLLVAGAGLGTAIVRRRY